MSFLKKLRNQCKNCKASTIKVYFNGVKRLLRLYDEDKESIPEGSTWLMSAKLKKKVKSIPVNIRRHLSSAAFIATKVYKIKSDNYWNTQMLDDIKKYEFERNKNKKSPYEEKNMPKNLGELKKAGREYRKRIARVYGKEKPTLADLFKVQKWLIIRLSYALPFRSDLPTINIEKQTGNYLKTVKKGFHVIMTKFKASEKIGEKDITLGKAEVTVLKRFLKYRKKAGVEHDFLLTARSGKPMSKRGYSQILAKVTEDMLGKKVGPRILRVLYATEHKEILAAAKEIQDKMLHGNQKQTKQYTRK